MDQLSKKFGLFAPERLYYSKLGFGLVDVISGVSFNTFAGSHKFMMHQFKILGAQGYSDFRA